MTLHLHEDPYVDSIVMPENLKVAMMVNQVGRECARKGISCKYTGFAFGQSPFHVPEPLEKALGAHANKGHYSGAEGIPEIREAIAGFSKRYVGLTGPVSPLWTTMERRLLSVTRISRQEPKKKRSTLRRRMHPE